jgi:tRNA (mo5U34)-methyltransferase
MEIASITSSSFMDWIRSRVQSHPYWFHKIELGPDLITPGWDDPKVRKLPYFGLPADMRGMRVLDIGCREGFLSFKAQRRGATEVVAIDGMPSSIERFHICKEAVGSRVKRLPIQCI